jgi:rhamnogalacturonyl hydrolase YesR
VKKVNGYWQLINKEHQNAFWHRAVYHIGNLAAYKTTGIEAYRSYSEAWAEKNEWKGAKSNDKLKWKYTYGETDDFVLFGDWQVCFQVYADLYNLSQSDNKIARAREVMEYQMNTSAKNYWWWADGLFMVMPVMTKYYKITGNQRYLDKLYEYFKYSKALMYDSVSNLFYRDAKYIYPKHQTTSGKKDFWARGNGWVFAALAKVLEDLPTNDPHRAEFIKIYKDMAFAIGRSQQVEGYWTRSMLDPYYAPGPETSGTAFFTYGFLWGMNNGILDKLTYHQVALKGWQYLTQYALQPSGLLGFVQPIGEKAIPGQIIDRNSTADFAVGAFLMAAYEMKLYSKVL